MDNLEQLRDVIEKVLNEYAAYVPDDESFEKRTVFDRERDQYLFVTFGWNGKRRVHNCDIHIEIRNEKIWIESDNTEEGIALDLENAGVPKEKIVLGFRHPEIRPYTEYAAA